MHRLHNDVFMCAFKPDDIFLLVVLIQWNLGEWKVDENMSNSLKLSDEGPWYCVGNSVSYIV